MAQCVSGETVFTCDEMPAFYRRSDEDRLTEISVGVEESNEAFDFHVIQLAGEMRNRVVPANQAVGDHVEPGFHLLGDNMPGHFILHVEKIGSGSVAAVERSNCSPQRLQFRRIADARVAARTRKMEARSCTHFGPHSCCANSSTSSAAGGDKLVRPEGLRENWKESASGAKARLNLR